MDSWLGAESTLLLPFMERTELSWKATISIYDFQLSIYVPTLNCGPELWVLTERMRSQTQATKIIFLCRVAELSLRDRVSRCRKVPKMPPGYLPLEVFRALLIWRRP